MADLSKNKEVKGVSSKLGRYLNKEWGDDVPQDLIGATILRFGAPISDGDFEGGGLVIDYMTTEGEKKRVVFEFTEIGMWVSQYLKLSGSDSSHSGLISAM